MITINFNTVTVPTPAPYDAAKPQQQAENFYYALNQILSQCTGSMNIDLAEEISGLATQSTSFELPGLKITRHGRVISFVIAP